MNTLVVNCYAGPGAGKTTCAWEVAAELKKKGINCEYVSEYPKELVWEGKLDLLKNQEHIFKEQANRLARLRGKVEVIVTDSPILMSHIYGENNSDAFTQRIDAEYNKYYNFNLFIQRGKGFQQEGRLQNREESVALDKKIKDMLKGNNIFYGVYKHENVKYISDNIIRNLEKIRKQPEIDIKVISTLPDAEVYDGLYGKEMNAGYYITDKISINNETYVMGFNPEAPESYVTWQVKDGEYGQGHYYINEQRAKENLYQRALAGKEDILSDVLRKINVSELSNEKDDIQDINSQPEENSYQLPKDFDRESFINAIEISIDYGEPISQDDYDLYQRLVEERAAEETVDMEFDGDMGM